jgi:competence ComEA-like helix-hairpin-helix protein
MADDSVNGPADDQAEERGHPRTAGPFGFSRPEIIVLAVVASIVIAFSVLQWMKRREAARVPAWSVEDVLIDTLQAKADFTTSTDDDAGRTTTDVNIASRSELTRLPGIGAVLANRIIASREQNGPFTNLIDFQRVPGIGPKRAAALAGWVRFSTPGQTK